VQASRRDPVGLAHPGRLFAIIAISILIVDQVTKALVRGALAQGQAIILVPRLLHLTIVHNEGAAFGLFPGGQPFFIVTSLIVLAAIAVYWFRTSPRDWLVVTALAMVTAGAVGNLIDRALIGQVTDFLEFAFIDFPVFNVADMGIVGGVGVLVLWVLITPEQTTGTPDNPEAQTPDTTQEHA